jgi:hypothetical protein
MCDLIGFINAHSTCKTIIFDYLIIFSHLIDFPFSLFQTVIATIAICLFPLWPSNIREYIWYLSVIAAVAVGMILVLAVCKY